MNFDQPAGYSPYSFHWDPGASPGESTRSGADIRRDQISPMAVELLQRVKALSGDSPWLFPSPRGNKPIAGAAVDHSVRLALNSLEMKHFTPHDLRRSAATFMTVSCGIPRLVVSKILNHAEPHITAVYDRASYDQEKPMALEAWGRKLQSIVKGVDPLNGARAK